MMKFFKSMFTRGSGEIDKDDDRLIELQTVKGLFDPVDRPLTDEERNSPVTFFGVPYQVRKERIEQAAAHEPPAQTATPPTPTDWAALHRPLTVEQVRAASQPKQDDPDQSRSPRR